MKQPRSVVMVGNFDGVHVGHAALVEQARKIADAQSDPTRVVALTFDPHPIAALRPAEAPARLARLVRAQADRLAAQPVSALAEGHIQFQPAREVTR